MNDSAAVLLPSISYLAQRQTMVERQVRTFGVVDGAVLARMAEVPRELFLPPELLSLAYSDATITLPGATGGERRTLLPPMVLARMIEAAGVKATDRVLDLAGATGYSAAILAGLAGSVLSVDTQPAFTGAANANFAVLSIPRAEAVTAPLDQPADGRFDVILVNGGIEANFEPLFDQLDDNGRLVAILCSGGAAHNQTCKATLYEKSHGKVGWRDLFDASAPVLPPFRTRPRFTL